jgi:hypothetical protein
VVASRSCQAQACEHQGKYRERRQPHGFIHSTLPFANRAFTDINPTT